MSLTTNENAHRHQGPNSERKFRSVFLLNLGFSYLPVLPVPVSMTLQCTVKSYLE